MLAKLFLCLFLSSLVIAEEPERTESTKNTEAEPNKNDFSHGFGKDIDWVDWKTATSTAMELDKPIFLLIHKTWCGACKLLKQSFETSNKKNELIELSKQFVMTNIEDDEEPEEDLYAPDGRYIPRLFFLDKNGQPLDVDNKNNYAKNAYYYPQVPDVIKAMRKALKMYKGVAEQESRETEQKEEKKTEETSKKTKTEKQPAQKKSKSEREAKTTSKNTKNESAKKSEEKSKTKEEKKKAEKEKDEDTKPTGGCPHAAGAAKAKVAKKAAAEKTDSKNGETEKTLKENPSSSNAKETKKSGNKQAKKSEL